ncbi:MAG: cobalamin-binding protein [Dehalococcoidia bacterium]|nr:cobalamin-binding protein [Dehalococcoidia bacterium]
MRMRVISLLPSATEIVCALGQQGSLVGRSHECDFPSGVSALPICSRPKFVTDGTSYGLNQRVIAILQEAASIYRLDAKLMNRLKPDLIITQSQCDVCAISQKEVEAAVCQLIGTQPRIISLEPNALSDVYRDISSIAVALDVPAAGESLIQSMMQGMALVKTRTAKLPRPRVVCIEWLDPIMAAGNWMPELVEIAGGHNLFGSAGKHSPWIQWPDVITNDPDLLFISPCGYDLARTRKEMALLEDKPGWGKLKAVRNGKVYIADGNQYFNRPGPRLVDSLKIMAEIFHPVGFKHEYEGSGWQNWR